MSCQCRGLVVVVCSVLLICCLLPAEASSHLRARGRGLSQFRQQEISDYAPSPVAALAPSVAPLPLSVVVPEVLSAAAPSPMNVLPMSPAAAPSPPMMVMAMPPAAASASPAAIPGQTSLSVAHTKGTSELKVASVAGFEVGQEVIIDPDTPLAEANRIIGLGFASLRFQSPLLHDHAADAVVMVLIRQQSTLPPRSFEPIAPQPLPPGTTPAPPASTSEWQAVRATPLPTNQPLLAGSICATVNSCSGCTALPECGWCALEMKCVDGTKLGPRTEQCMAYDFMHCPNIDCASRTTCTDCLIDHGCGWCASTARCAGGDGVGPFAIDTCPAPRDFKDARPVWAHAFAATKCEDTPVLHSSHLWDSLRGMMYRSRARMARIDAQAAMAAAVVPPPPPPVTIGTAAPCTAMPGRADTRADSDSGISPVPMNQAMTAGGMPPMMPMFGGIPGAPPPFMMPGYPAGVMWQTPAPPVLPTTLAPETTEKATEKSTTTELITTTLATTTLATTIATTLSTTPCPTPAPTAPTTPLIMMWTPPPGTPPPPLPPPPAPQRRPIQVNVDINQHVATKAHAHQVHQHNETSKKTKTRSEISEAPDMSLGAAGTAAMSPSGPPPFVVAPAPAPVVLPASLQPVAYETNPAVAANPAGAGIADALPSSPKVTPSLPPIDVPQGTPSLPPIEGQPKLPPFPASNSQ